MTDSMNFGPEWLRNLSSDGSTTGGTGGAVRYQLSGYRYGREEMLGLYEKGFKPPASLSNFTTLYSEQPLVPLVLTPTTEEERMWQNRPPPINPSIRGSRGSSLERGGRGSRGRGAYNSYGRNVGYENTGGPGGGWGNGEQQEWSPRKDYSYRSSSVDNWRRNPRTDEDDGWRSATTRGGSAEKWGRSTGWRDGDKEDDRGGPHNRSWHDGNGGGRGGHAQRRGWEEEGHPQPEWFTEQLGEGGGTFDSSGAYHGSDDEQEQRGGGTPGRRELQKSASQQNISPRQPPSLSSSKSSGSLNKQMENDIKEEMALESSMKDVQDPKDRQDPPEKFKSETDRLNMGDQKLPPRSDRRENDEQPHQPHHHKVIAHMVNSNPNMNGIISEQGLTNRVEEDFDRMQEDLVSKLVVEEESPKATMNAAGISIPGVGVAVMPPPPNLVPPIQDKWYYQDPQGDLQGPFVSTEMAEWFKAGYFTLSLLVRRRCDKSFYTLGDLVTICNGGNPFLSTTAIPPLKEPPPVKKELLNLQYLQTQMALRQVAQRAYNPAEWANLSPMQRDLLSQHMMPQQHPQMSPVELQYLQQPPQQAPTNPLMHMISQMQQVNKLPGQTMTDQPPNSMPMQMDPLQALVQQMHSLQRIQPTGATIPGMGHPPNIPTDNMMGMAGVHGQMPVPGMSPANMGGVPGGPVPQSALDGLSIPNDDNPINTLLRQLQSKNIQSSQPIDSMWQQNQFVPPHTQPNNQWQQPQPTPPPTQPPMQQQQQQQQQQSQPNEAPLSMWDLPQQSMTANIAKPSEPAVPATQQVEEPTQQAKEKEASRKEKEREERKRKELEEKQQKKEAEEKRKQEQRRQELEKKAAEDKRKKEEERIKKELEKAKKEAEEKRQRELEEKRRLKEQRKAEEEAKKKAEQQKKIEDEEQLEMEHEMLREARRQAETNKQAQEGGVKFGKVAPWSQSCSNSGPSLADIQKAEREKRLEQAMIQQQQRAQQIQEQQTIEKASIQLSWANKPLQPRQVKSLAEIQAEEQEKLAKQAAERLAQQQKDKETNVTSVSTGIWQGQNLTWANTASQWPTSNNAGFWDDVPSPKPVSKPSNIVKSNSTSAMAATPKPTQQQQQPPKQVKVKAKKEESVTTTTTTTGGRNNNVNGPASEEFTQWCIRALSNVASTVDIPTFIGFLKDIESAAEVKDYCRDYLGESPAMHQFMAQFLEKRRYFKPRMNAHKDDMCSPAPAITPSSQHNAEFQEGKGKKCKKSKMTKIDARILGFNVTAAHDRVNVGDRDCGDN